MLRHSAITQAVEKSVGMGPSLDKVRDFSRHKNIGTLMVYRDNMTNEQGNLAEAVAATAATKGDAGQEPDQVDPRVGVNLRNDGKPASDWLTTAKRDPQIETLNATIDLVGQLPKLPMPR